MTKKLSEYLKEGNKSVRGIHHVWLRLDDAKKPCGCAVGMIAYAVCGVPRNAQWASDLMNAIEQVDPAVAEQLEAVMLTFDEDGDATQDSCLAILSSLYEAQFDPEDGVWVCLKWLEDRGL